MTRKPKRKTGLSENPSHDSLRSQTKATWVTSGATVLCVVISIVSLYFSIQAKELSQKESCFLRVRRVDENYKTELHRFGTSGIGEPEEHYYLMTFWDCTVINTANKPITIVSYSTRKIDGDSFKDVPEEWAFSTKTENGAKE